MGAERCSAPRRAPGPSRGSASSASVGLKQLFFEDPDGNVIELIERR
ncbi:MAG: hypothetical protein HYV08_12475 [Deltaproteobacteria bacterium]|nr:hypothetical protein [Deltaproteobacteria bacterium]MBI3076363.1 hypothetical protein [Deltaproteobacteria bacterium]